MHPNDDPNIQPPPPTFGPPEVVSSQPAPVLLAYPPPPRHSPASPHPNFWWAILWCVAMVLCTQIPGGVAAAMVLVLGLLVGGTSATSTQELMADPVTQAAMVVGILVAHGLLILFSLLCLRLIAGRDWYRQVALRLPSLAHVGLVIAVTPAFITLGSGAYELLKLLGVPSMQDLLKQLLPGPGGGTSPGFDMEEIERMVGGWPMLIAIFCIGVVPGLSEELWCRAFLGRGIVGRHGYVLGILGTSFLFGAIHVDPRQGAMAIFMGVGLHYVYQMTRSLLVPMLLHFLNNSLAVTLPRVPALRDFALDQAAAPWHLYASAAVLMAAVCWALYQSRARLVTPPGEFPWVPPFDGVACPPPDSATRVVAPLPDAVSAALVLAGLAAMGASVATMVR